ncbi:endolytic transglycosylase MltG [Chitiniphilus purpureus]|uniref:Endolytic murein transglycosylase n=1 Tax=Chitiniphilus purpureus TaxID=2981137 RepID=A0ABY6DKW1_9NEIS|nr:endolytic transglycosylase MltG [Chitiniphilus sp. CD1]UXY15001.1 endolytic transglycosylase MltG [Chitiniphilus sp. CD1]
MAARKTTPQANPKPRARRGAGRRPGSGGGFLRALRNLALLSLLGVLAVTALGYWYVTRPLPLAYPVTVTIGPGSVRATAAQLAQQRVIELPIAFRLLARLTGEDTRLKAGVYELKQPISMLDLLGKIARGEASQIAFTVIEGWSWRELRSALARQNRLKPEATLMSDAELLMALGIDAPALEGQFFPDTYYIAIGASDLQLLTRAHQRMRDKLAAAWQARDPQTPLKSPYEALILASIVEKETGSEVDRAMIAGVFSNRLRIGMRLQTDPTVIYGLGTAFDGNIRKRDLQADTPYNTYTRAGLPPTPIAMPGVAALMAAVRPAPSKALYFVARGDGSSHFSETLQEHNRAVDRYIRGK